MSKAGRPRPARTWAEDSGHRGAAGQPSGLLGGGCGPGPLILLGAEAGGSTWRGFSPARGPGVRLETTGPPPPRFGGLGKMLGAEEFPSEVRAVRGCLAGQRGGLLGPLTRPASRNGGLPAAAEKEPARGCAWAVRWGRVGAQLRSRLGGTTLMSRRAGNRLSPSPSPFPYPQAGAGCRDWAREGCPAGAARLRPRA